MLMLNFKIKTKKFLFGKQQIKTSLEYAYIRLSLRICIYFLS